jgi:hypothetical protein
MVAPVISLPSNKHSGVSGMTTQLFCQHSGETPLRGGYAESLTRNNNADPKWQASWPSFVDPIARVRQIPWPNSAWTQGYANSFAVGLECAGYAHFTKAQWLTAEGRKQLENLAHEWAYYWLLEKKAGNTIPLRWLTDSEVRAVMAGNRSIKGFCTHRQIDPASRTDPGPNFPYAELLNRVAQLIGGTTVATPTTPTPIKSAFDTFMEQLMSWYASKSDFENRMRQLAKEGAEANNPAATRDLLTYNNTKRTDRDFYALVVDAGLNSVEANTGIKAVLNWIAEVPAKIGAWVLGYRGKDRVKDVYQDITDVRTEVAGPPALTTDPAPEDPEAPIPPEPAEPPQLPAGAGTYTVQKGDTLSGIARTFNTTAAWLARENKITDPNRLEAGQDLKVPALER